MSRHGSLRAYLRTPRNSGRKKGFMAGVELRWFHIHISDFSFGIARHGKRNGGFYSWHPLYFRFKNKHGVGRRFTLAYKSDTVMDNDPPHYLWDPFNQRTT